MLITTYSGCCQEDGGYDTHWDRCIAYFRKESEGGWITTGEDLEVSGAGRCISLTYLIPIILYIRCIGHSHSLLAASHELRLLDLT